MHFALMTPEIAKSRVWGTAYWKAWFAGVSLDEQGDEVLVADDPNDEYEEFISESVMESPPVADEDRRLACTHS